MYFNRNVELLLLVILSAQLKGLKIFEFSDSLEEKSRVSIENNSPTPRAFTLCLDLYNRLDTDRRFLRSEGSKDIDILITEDAKHIYIQVAGIWSLACWSLAC